MTVQALPPAICLMGPTASGKTALAMALQDVLPVELISVDSALVYRGLDIGSAKPTAEELAAYPHRLIDIADPAEPYSAADFRRDALAAMAEITAAGRIPLLVGGTMLYFKALLEGLAEMPEADADLRAAIQAEAELNGWPALHQQLAEVDPQAAERIHPNHSQRLSRALEVYRASGVPISEWQAKQAASRPAYRFLQMAIAPQDRGILHQRIAVRLEQMWQQGFLQEVQGLRQREDLHLELPAIRAVGYRQAWCYLNGDYDEQTLRDKALFATRQLAKRQLTWLRKWPDLHWLYSDHGVPVSEAKDLLAAQLSL